MRRTFEKIIFRKPEGVGWSN